MFSKHIKIALIAIVAATAPQISNAITIERGDVSFKLTGYGTGGFIEPDFETPVFIGDWRVRGELGWDATEEMRLGAVYAIDASAADEETYMREGFVFFQNKNYGRAEFGFTDSVARKLGVGLPDVGGLRVNDKPLFYKKISPDGAVISDTTLTTGRDALRLNLVSMPRGGAQYGMSVAGITDDYDYAIDGALKLRQSDGKVKTAYALGASFMGRPDGYTSDSFTPAVYADWRAQISAGMNLQYNSWMWGLTGRLVYDENPVGITSDGLALGTAVSYDFLHYSVSLSYILSDTGVWNHDVDDYIDNTVVGSFRYKYSENVDLWMSAGTTSKTPFFSVGLRLTI